MYTSVIKKKYGQILFHFLVLFEFSVLKLRTKLQSVVRLYFWNLFERRVTGLLLLLQGSLWPGVVVPVTVSFMGQINLVESFWY